LTTCASDNLKIYAIYKKIFFCHNKLKKDVEDHELKELFKDDEIARLMSKCVVV